MTIVTTETKKSVLAQSDQIMQLRLYLIDQCCSVQPCSLIHDWNVWRQWAVQRQAKVEQREKNQGNLHPGKL
jgi:hypothetical protein